MTEDEIAQAVDMYVQSNQKRVETRQRTQEERRALLRKLPDTTTDRTTAHRVPLNALAWDRDPKALEEARRIRAERAKQTRFLAGRGFSSEVIRKILDWGDD